MNLYIKLKGGALYIAVIISILISVILGLFIVLAYHNTQSLNVRSSVSQLELSLESGFEMAGSDYFLKENQGRWQKMPFNNDSVLIKNLQWGCFNLVSVTAKNKHHRLSKTGLFGSTAFADTALMVAELGRPIGLAGKIKFKGNCYLPKAGIKTAYIEGTSFSDLNSLRPYVKPSPGTIPAIDENYLKSVENVQSELNPGTDSLISFIPDVLNHSFNGKTAVVQSGSLNLNSQVLSNNIKIISSGIITVDNTCLLSNVLLIARKVVFKKGFKGSVHVIAKDSIVTEDECEFNYPSSFCVHPSTAGNSLEPQVNGIFFGEHCQFKGGILAANGNGSFAKMMIKTNKSFELIGSIYSSGYAEAQGAIYGSFFCNSLLLQTPSAVYENHLLNCQFDPKRYSANLTVPNWFTTKQKHYSCAKWFY